MAADGTNVPAVPPIVVGPGSNYANLAERCRDVQEDYRKTVRRAAELESSLRQTLHPDIMTLVDEWMDRRGEIGDAWTDVMAAELGRHLPGLAPVIMLLWEHVRSITPKNVAHCCAGEGSFEPGDDDEQS